MKISPKTKNRVTENASKSENNKYPMASFRFSSETIGKAEQLRLAIANEDGKIPSRTKIFIRALDEMHAKYCKEQTSL
jgi:hypothetical protein